MPAPAPVTVRIERLVHGGDGLARDAGGAVFVPLTAPGDLVRIGPEPPRSGARRGRLLEVLEPGPARVVPPCPHAGTCGGCSWQQVARAEQIAQKQHNVRDALLRIGRFSEPLPLRAVVPSPLAQRYRRRLRVHPVRGGWGFSERAGHVVVPVTDCLLAEEPVVRLATAFASALRALGGFGAVRSIGVDASADGRGAVHLELAQQPGTALRARAARLVAAVPGLGGVVLSGGERPTTVAVGDPVLVDAEHWRLRVRPDLFAQANRLGARLLAAHVAQTVEPGASVLEIYAGAGTLTLALAERAGRVVATEGDGPALDLLRLALADNGRQARLVAGPARRTVAGLASESFDHVVLDPPRTGARDVLDCVVGLKPQRITYVSCDPPTFARDAAVLSAAGWSLREVVPFDLFPDTFHVELCAVLERA